MSPRAAWRLERLGFTDVHDYAAGKVDWMAAGLPTVRADTTQRRALDIAHRDPLTCSPDTQLAVAAHHAAQARQRSVVVLNDAGIVLGRLGPHELDGPVHVLVEAVMQPGPTTVRAHEALDPLLDRMAKEHVREMIVTTPEGRLLGLIHRDQDGST
jgi:CBS domain-containing protein